MEEVLLEWIDNRRARSLRVSCKLIMKKAEIVYPDITPETKTATEDFKASRGWLYRFMKRNGLSLRRKASVAQQDPERIVAKVHLQTQQNVTLGLSGMAVQVVKLQGVRGLYNGLTASVMRQLTYSTTRYGLYEIWSGKLRKGNEPLPFYQKIGLGAVSGFLGGIVGNPADMINVRMQNDIKLPVEKRRNYKHVFDGLYKSATQEGVPTWMRGVTMTSTRALLMTVAQVACYDQTKQVLLSTQYFNENIFTHFTASFIAGTIATGLTQPFDVMKTRLMEARPGQYKNALQCLVYTAKLGPMGFYKGFIPAWIRLAPHTIITWIFLEQLRRLFPLE